MPVKPYSRVRLSVCALSLVLLALSWGYFALTFARERQALETQAEKHVQTVALGFEEYARRIIQVQDMLLLDIIEHLRHGEQPSALHGLLSQWLVRSEQLGDLLLVNAATQQVLDSASRSQVGYRVRPRIPPLSEEDLSTLQIGDRIYQGPAGQDQLALSRQVVVGSGRFAVIALLQTHYLLDFYPFAELGKDGSLSILHKDGALLACLPRGENLFEGSFAKGASFKKILSGNPIGISWVPAENGHTRQIIAYRQLGDLPLVLTVGVSLDRIVAEWKSRLVNFIAIQLAISIAIVLSMLLLVRALSRMEKAEIGLREREEHFRALADSSVDGVISVDRKGRVRFWGQGAEKVFGYTATVTNGMLLSALLDFERPTPILDILSELALNGYQQTKGGTVEARGIHSNGWLFPVELSVSTGKVNEQVVYTLIVRDVTERRLLEERIRRMASHDVLTRLPNRALLMDRLEVAIAQVRREGGCFALLFLDLDEFKPVNDQFGHEVGDQLLQQVAERLHASFRASDTVARVGGDEFAALLHNVQSEAAVSKTCHTIIAALGEEYLLGEIHAQIGCSIGAALYSGQQLSGADLMRMADAAMYEAKRSGKNSCRLISCADRYPDESAD